MCKMEKDSALGQVSTLAPKDFGYGELRYLDTLRAENRSACWLLIRKASVALTRTTITICAFLHLRSYWAPSLSTIPWAQSMKTHFQIWALWLVSQNTFDSKPKVTRTLCKVMKKSWSSLCQSSCGPSETSLCSSWTKTTKRLNPRHTWRKHLKTMPSHLEAVKTGTK